LTGFQYGLKNNVSGCDVYLKQVRVPGTITGWNTLSTPQYVHCQTGINDGLHQVVVTTPQYKVGFQLGKSDSYLGINDVDTACKRYPGDGNWGPNYFCRVGYDSANSEHFKPEPDTPASISAFHQTLPYKIGFKTGVENKADFCNSYNGTRDYATCSKGFDDGFKSNMATWRESVYWRHGFKLGLHDARLKITGDSVGACNSYENTNAENLCIRGYDVAYEKYNHP